MDFQELEQGVKRSQFGVLSLRCLIGGIVYSFILIIYFLKCHTTFSFFLTIWKMENIAEKSLLCFWKIRVPNDLLVSYFPIPTLNHYTAVTILLSLTPGRVLLQTENSE